MTGHGSALLSRRVLALFLLVVAFTMAELGHWVHYNVTHSTEQLLEREAQLERDQRLATELIMLRAQLPGAEAHTPVDLLAGRFPYLEWQGGRGTTAEQRGAPVAHGVVVRAGVREDLQGQHRSRVRMFLWESGFFLAILLLGVALILRTMRREVRLRRQQGNFLSAVTHELKSPLASIKLFAETMQMREDLPVHKRARYLSNIRQDTDRLEALVGNLLAVARLEANSFDVSPQSRDLRADVDELCDALRADVIERGGSLEVALPGEAVAARYDIGVLRTALRNLIDNAVKYGGEAKRVEVRLRRDVSQVVIEVCDDGIGVPQDERERIFDKFYRVGDEMVRQAEGSGLGLFLVRQLARQCQGDVFVRDGPSGRGALFALSFPAVSTQSLPDRAMEAVG